MRGERGKGIIYGERTEGLRERKRKKKRETENKGEGDGWMERGRNVMLHHQWKMPEKRRQLCKGEGRDE